MTAHNAETRALVEALRIPHLNVEDCWYSCPKSVDGCCNDNYPDDVCACGADTHNAKVDALLKALGFDGTVR